MQKIESNTIRLRRCALLGMRTVLSVSKTVAKFRMMHASEPTRPTVEALTSLTSMSQRPTPFHQLARLSVGQRRALMKLKTLQRIIQKTKVDAARLRFLICQTKEGTFSTRVMNDSKGRAIAPGERR